jgi:hypothetical protein
MGGMEAFWIEGRFRMDETSKIGKTTLLGKGFVI